MEEWICAYLRTVILTFRRTDRWPEKCAWHPRRECGISALAPRGVRCIGKASDAWSLEHPPLSYDEFVKFQVQQIPGSQISKRMMTGFLAETNGWVALSCCNTTNSIHLAKSNKSENRYHSRHFKARPGSKCFTCFEFILGPPSWALRSWWHPSCPATCASDLCNWS